jgi:hypothetical protein
MKTMALFDSGSDASGVWSLFGCKRPSGDALEHRRAKARVPLESGALFESTDTHRIPFLRPSGALARRD